MLILFAVIISGIIAGRLLSSRRLAFVPRLVTGIIWVLLFVLGAEVGGDEAVVRGMVTLGRTALIICALSLLGSIAASWALWRYVRARGVGPQEFDDVSREAVPMWTALRGSLVIVAFFAIGCGAGMAGVVPSVIIGMSTYVLYALMFTVGVTLGHDTSLAGRVRRLDPRLALLPVATAVGTLAGAALAAPFVAPVSVTDSLAVGSGFGYYSLSAIFIADLRGAELGAVALLCNVMRELFTLLAAPLVVRWFGPLAAVSIGGATTFDTTLPVITQAAGRPYAVVAVFHGCVLDFSVPFLVTFFCGL